ncbi:PCYCGC motif-containing (lipo)protein [Rossellomorea aquimaris]|uniref:PCYCGC motif-containing (lipo)protein n=1 Tax=Rossellomorea aquimaris TaxID=189382 RepID=UPI0007D06A75|nr:PCYCGC motif-containing (lipo)protein [Rossellomorea aquimaris]
MKKRVKLFASNIVILIMVLGGCASQQEESIHEKHETMGGDIQEETHSVEDLPNFLNDKDENMQLIYTSAAKSEELLKYIPCYCGCGDSAGHENNLNCFVHEIKDEKIVWDDHGTKCQVCIDIAAEAIVKYNKGQAIKDIRDDIDAKYKEGYAKPTPTPMPS